MWSVKCKVIITSFLFIIFSCEKEYYPAIISRNQSSPIYSINSKNNTGYSFSNQGSADLPGTNPDFIIIPQKGITGDMLTPFLLNSNLENRFVLAGEFNNPVSAQAYFEEDIPSETGNHLQQFAFNLKANQVWLVKSNDGTYGKILIIEIRTDRSKKAAFAEIKFKAEKIG